MSSILGSDSQVRTSAGGGGGVGPMRTKADKGKGGSILAYILRTSFMDDPLGIKVEQKRANVFYSTFLNVFYFFLERFLHLWSSS